MAGELRGRHQLSGRGAHVVSHGSKPHVLPQGCSHNLCSRNEQWPLESSTSRSSRQVRWRSKYQAFGLRGCSASKHKAQTFEAKSSFFLILRFFCALKSLVFSTVNKPKDNLGMADTLYVIGLNCHHSKNLTNEIGRN